MTGLRLALGFLTTVPLGRSGELTEGDLGRSAVWFAPIGLALGGVLWVGWMLLAPATTPMLVAALLVLIWVLATGALHLDGLADCCDGLLVSAAPQRRLEIMRDSRSGAFAVVGIVMILLLKVAAVASLSEPTALLLAPLYGRWWMLPLARGRSAREQGLGAALRAELGLKRFILPALLTVTVTVLAGWTALLALALSGTVILLLYWLARARIGGVTGDVLGASCELAEWTTLATFALLGGL